MENHPLLELLRQHGRDIKDLTKWRRRLEEWRDQSYLWRKEKFRSVDNRLDALEKRMADAGESISLLQITSELQSQRLPDLSKSGIQYVVDGQWVQYFNEEEELKGLPEEVAAPTLWRNVMVDTLYDTMIERDHLATALSARDRAIHEATSWMGKYTPISTRIEAIRNLPSLVKAAEALQTNGVHEIVNRLRWDDVDRSDLADYLQSMAGQARDALAPVKAEG